MATREDTNMMATRREVEDRIQPRSRQSTTKIEVVDPWMTIGPDEVTVRDTSESQPPSYAELIRLMTASYREHEPS